MRCRTRVSAICQHLPSSAVCRHLQLSIGQKVIRLEILNPWAYFDERLEAFVSRFAEPTVGFISTTRSVLYYTEVAALHAEAACRKGVGVSTRALAQVLGKRVSYRSAQLPTP